MSKSLNGNLTLIRSLVEEIPADGMGARAAWTWTPVVEINPIDVVAGSPTTEYSSNESAE